MVTPPPPRTPQHFTRMRLICDRQHFPLVSCLAPPQRCIMLPALAEKRMMAAPRRRSTTMMPLILTVKILIGTTLGGNASGDNEAAAVVTEEAKIISGLHPSERPLTSAWASSARRGVIVRGHAVDQSATRMARNVSSHPISDRGSAARRGRSLSHCMPDNCGYCSSCPVCDGACATCCPPALHGFYRRLHTVHESGIQRRPYGS